MTKLTLECWSRGRVDTINILLASLMNQTFQDWDLTLLQEADCNYLANPLFVGLVRRLKLQGHKIIMLHPRTLLGCVKSAVAVMAETNTKYAMKLDDDHVFEKNALEILVNSLEDNDDIAVVGGMLYPISIETTYIDKVPKDFNRWTGKKYKIWNDYTTLAWQFPDELVDVDFVRAPFMYRADMLRSTDWLEEYPTLGYSPTAFRIESEMANTLMDMLDVKTAIHTGVDMYHYAAPTGGWRMWQNPYSYLDPDGEIYYSRWLDFHKKKVESR